MAPVPAARALLRVFDQDEKTLHHVYRKWQGPHWTLTCLALIDYPPGDAALRPGSAASTTGSSPGIFWNRR